MEEEKKIKEEKIKKDVQGAPLASKFTISEIGLIESERIEEKK